MNENLKSDKEIALGYLGQIEDCLVEIAILRTLVGQYDSDWRTKYEALAKTIGVEEKGLVHAEFQRIRDQVLDAPDSISIANRVLRRLERTDEG